MGKEVQLKANEDYKRLGKPIPYPHLETIEEIKEDIIEEPKEDNSIEEL